MNIASLQPRQGKVELTAKVIEKQEPRSFSRESQTGRVCNAVLQDETGKVKITLWNEQIDQVNVGDTIKITNGYVGEWQGELQLSTGKFGKLDILESAPQPKPVETPNETVIDEEEIE